MTKHRTGRPSGGRLARPFKVVVFDLMNTILWGRAGHRTEMANIYLDYFGLPRGGRRPTKARVLDVIAEVEGEFAAHSDKWDPSLRYPVMNARIGLRLREEVSNDGTVFTDQDIVRSTELIAAGLEVHDRIQSEMGSWKVTVEVRRMLGFLESQGVPLYLGTNQKPAYVDRHMESRGLDRWFPEERRFVSSTMGIWKPQVQFIERIAERIGVAVEDIVYVGNSPRHDAPLVVSGCQVILLDHDDRYAQPLRSEKFKDWLGVYQDRHELIVVKSTVVVSNLLKDSFCP